MIYVVSKCEVDFPSLYAGHLQAYKMLLKQNIDTRRLKFKDYIRTLQFDVLIGLN